MKKFSFSQFFPTIKNSMLSNFSKGMERKIGGSGKMTGIAPVSPRTFIGCLHFQSIYVIACFISDFSAILFIIALSSDYVIVEKAIFLIDEILWFNWKSKYFRIVEISIIRIIFSNIFQTIKSFIQISLFALITRSLFS